MSLPLIEVKQGSFSYHRTVVFEKINLSLKKNEILCLFGPNGCGKTTLLENILGLLKLQKGSIFLDKKDIKTLKENEIAKKIAYLPQIHNKTFPYKVKEIVLMGRAPYTSIFSAPSKRDHQKVDEVLKLVGINHLKNRPYINLSGGESRLVMLARALAQNSEIIIMDEPTSHLDFRNELEVLEIITALIQQKKISVIMATHFPNQAFYFKNKGIKTTLALMNDKIIKLAGPPEEVLTEKNMKSIFNIKSKILSYDDLKREKLKYLIPLEIIKK